MGGLVEEWSNTRAHTHNTHTWDTHTTVEYVREGELFLAQHSAKVGTVQAVYQENVHVHAYIPQPWIHFWAKPLWGGVISTERDYGGRGCPILECTGICLTSLTLNRWKVQLDRVSHSIHPPHTKHGSGNMIIPKYTAPARLLMGSPHGSDTLSPTPTPGVVGSFVNMRYIGVMGAQPNTRIPMGSHCNDGHTCTNQR